eukprot:comp12233_c0_seq1/m.7020 comp12233_c0_seq1/g.7020  ORF comp12233_c0_seq1/g.7020 comp12233_c0_seq1/m.7020 type:complete len:413 (-) comp12233_c0_seq1:575-1813(-)
MDSIRNFLRRPKSFSGAPGRVEGADEESNAASRARSLNTGTTATQKVLGSPMGKRRRAKSMSCIDNKSMLLPSIINMPLEDAALYTDPNNKVPDLVKQCINFLNQHGLDTKGIFRVSGNKKRILEYFEQYDNDYLSNCRDVDVLNRKAIVKRSLFEDAEGQPTAFAHDVAGVFQYYLRTMREPLIPADMGPYLSRYLEALRGRKGNQSVVKLDKVELVAMHTILDKLPEVNMNTLKLTIALLHNIFSNCAVNEMTPSNLGICVGISICRDACGSNQGDAKMAEIWIQNYREIFRCKIPPGPYTQEEAEGILSMMKLNETKQPPSPAQSPRPIKKSPSMTSFTSIFTGGRASVSPPTEEGSHPSEVTLNRSLSKLSARTIFSPLAGRSPKKASHTSDTVDIHATPLADGLSIP